MAAGDSNKHEQQHCVCRHDLALCDAPVWDACLSFSLTRRTLSLLVGLRPADTIRQSRGKSRESYSRLMIVRGGRRMGRGVRRELHVQQLLDGLQFSLSKAYILQ